jgi:hypothetical protein
MSNKVVVMRWGCPTLIDRDDVEEGEETYDHVTWMGGKPYPANYVRMTDNGIEPMGHRHAGVWLDKDIPERYVMVMNPRVAQDVWRMKKAMTLHTAWEEIHPVKIIFNGVTTICFFGDGTYVSARPQKDEVFCEETGVAMCIAKYIYGSRSKFLKAVDKGKQQ